MNRVFEKGPKTPEQKPTEELVAAMGEMQAGEMPFADFRNELANALYLDFRQAAGILDWLTEMEVKGDLPSHLFRVLESDVERICAEDVPTLIDTTSMLPKRTIARAKDGVARSPAAARSETDSEPAVVKADKPDSAAEETLKSGDAAEETLAFGERLAVGVNVGDVLLERYEILDIAEGGNMSQVFKARDLKANNPADEFCAVKALAPGMSNNGKVLRALQDEYEKGALLEHPNIVRYLRQECDGTLIFIVMEWLEGQTLASFLNAQPGVRQPLPWSYPILRQLNNALSCVHEKGLVHADVKPGNVMLLPDGRIKLFDFGVARAYGDARAKHIGFDAGVLGAATPAYASATVLDGKPPAPSDDSYSFACIAYRLLGGVRVFGRDSALAASTAGTKLPVIDSLSADQWHAMEQYLSHDSKNRPASGALLLRALDPNALSNKDHDVDDTPGERIRFLAIAVGSLALVAAVLWLGRGFLGDDKSPSTELADSVSESSSLASDSTELKTPEISQADASLNKSVLPLAENIATSESAATSGGADLTALPSSDTNSAEIPQAEINAEQNASIPSAVTQEGVSLFLDPAVTVATTASIVRSSGDGAFSVSLSLVTGANEQAVRAYLMPLQKNPGPHTLRLNSTQSSTLGSAEPVVFELQPYGQNSLNMHRDYRLVIVSADNSESILATVNIQVLNPVLAELEADAAANTVGFLPEKITVTENQSAISIVLMRLNSDGGEHRGMLTVSSDTAKADSDFFAPRSQSFVFAADETQYKVFLPLVNDGLAEPDESLFVSIDAVAGSGLHHTVEIVIQDDD